MQVTSFRTRLAALASLLLAAGSPTTAQQSVVIRTTRPAIVEAAKRQDANGLRALIAQHTDVNAAGPDGTTAVHWAASTGRVDLLNLLLGAGAQPDTANRYGVRPLSLAAEIGAADAVARLLESGADANATPPSGETALMLAARSGSVDAVEALLARGAAVDARERERGQTALMWAAAEGHVPVIAALLDGGASVSAVSHGPRGQVAALDTYAKPIRSNGRLDAFTPLMFAAQAGRLEAAQLLLSRGAWVDDTAPDGTSVLVLAIANGHYELASMLLDEGANPNQAGQGWNALVQVVRTKNPSIGQSPRVVPTGRVSPMELAKQLIAFGVEIDAPITKQIRDRYRTHMNMVGATAYIMAAKAGDAEMMKLLLKAGADPMAKTKAGRTALMVAAGIDMWYVNEDSGTNEDALEALKVALDTGIDVNALNDDGETALHGAAFRGSNEMVQLLVDHGARLDVVSKLGFTPLMVANGDQRISCNLQRRPWTVELLTKMMNERGIPIQVRTDEEKFRDGVSRGYGADSASPDRPPC